MNIFTGVEKKNDDFRRYFYTKINRWDSKKGSFIGGKTAGSTQGLRESKQRLREKEGVVLDGERKAAGSKESCQSVNVNVRIPQYHHTKSAVQPNQQYTLAELKKMKATELLVLLSQQGRVFNKRTRKQVSINAYLGGTSNIPRDNWKNLKTLIKL